MTFFKTIKDWIMAEDIIEDPFIAGSSFAKAIVSSVRMGFLLFIVGVVIVVALALVGGSK